LTARFGQLALDNAAFPLFAAKGSAQAVTSWGVGLNWFLNRDVRLIFDYEQACFTGGSQATGTVTAQDEKAFLTRVQFGF